MSATWVGIIAIVAGAVFCFRGYLALRSVIAIWGGFVGFLLGSWIAAAVTSTAILAGPVGWIAAIVGALLLGWLAYAFYAGGVIIGMGSVGFGLGTALAGLLSLPTWAVAVAGAAGAVALVAVALATNLPRLLLVLVSAAGGASAIVGGVGLLVGQLRLDLTLEALGGIAVRQWWLGLATLALFAAGVAAQLRGKSAATLRGAYK